MTKQEQIEEMTKLINSKEIYPCGDDVHCENCFCSHKDTAEKLYNAGYRKVDRFEEENERLREVNRQLNADYNRSLERLKSDCREIAELKANLEARLTCDFVRTAQKHAVQDFADKLKTQFEEKEQHYICMYDWNGHSAVTDCENEVDELLKEYEK